MAGPSGRARLGNATEGLWRDKVGVLRVPAAPISLGLGAELACSTRNSWHTVTVSGSNDQSQTHGTYKILDSTCNGLPQYKCGDCGETSFLWYHKDLDFAAASEWRISRYACYDSFPLVPDVYMFGHEDGNIAAWSRKWWEYNGKKWKKNHNIKVKCAGD